MEFVKQQFFLIVLVIVSGVMVLWPELRKLFGGGGEIGTLQATQLINRNNALVIDVREGNEYAAGHIRSARNIPVKELAQRLDELKKFKDKPIIVSCQTGTRSAAALRALRKGEFSQVYQLKGGLSAWEQASLPLERSE